MNNSDSVSIHVAHGHDLSIVLVVDITSVDFNHFGARLT